MRSRPIEDFWLSTDGDDWAPAFRRAQRTLGQYDSMELVLSSRTYRCATAVKIWTRLHIVGCSKYGSQSLASSSGAGHAVSRVWFNSGSHGFIVMYTGQNTWDTHTTTATDPATTDSTLGFTADARHCVFKDFVIEGIGGTSASGHYHGIIPLRAVTIEGCAVVEWPGYGLYLSADTGGTLLTAVADIGTVVTPRGNCNNAMFRDLYFLNTGRGNVLIRGNDSNAMLLDQITCQNAGQRMLPSPLTSSSISSGAGAAGPTLDMVFSSAGHGIAVDDWVILRGIVIGGTTYATKCYEPVRASAVAGANVTFVTSTATSQTWPTGGAASFGSTTRVVKPIQAIPSAGTFTADNTLQLTVPAHSFQLNDMVLLKDITYSGSTVSSTTYPVCVRVSATTSTTVTVIGPSNWPSSGSATLGSYPLIYGLEYQLYHLGYLNNTFSSCKMQPTVFGGVQTYSDSTNSVFLGHYEESSTTPTIVDGSTLTLGGNISDNTVADAYAATGTMLKPDGSGGLRVQKYLSAYPQYKDHGVESTLGGSNSRSLLEFQYRNKASGTEAGLYSNSYGVVLEGANGDNGGYLEFRNTTATGSTTLALPVAHNSRNPKTLLLNAGAYLGSVIGTGTSSTNPIANPEYYGYVGSFEITTGYQAFLFGDSKLLTITNVANNGSGVCRITTATHGMATGDRVLVTGVDAPAAANGKSLITVASSTAFDVAGAFSGSYTTYTATISTATYDSVYDATTITVTGASGTLVAGDRATVGSGANNRDIQVLYVSGSTIKVLGDFSSATGSITMYSGLVHRLHAICYASAAPSAGSWGTGDIVFNTVSTSNITHWRCTTGGAPGSWEPVYKSLGSFTNGSQEAILEASSGYLAITSVASDGGTEIRVTKATHGFLDGQRVIISGVGATTAPTTDINARWIIKDKTANTIDLTSSTIGPGVFTSSTGNMVTARARAYVSAAPTDGTWAVGDIAFNIVPGTGYETPDWWLCTVAGTPGTWVAQYANHRAYTVTGNVTRGHMGLIRVPFTAGAAGAQDDIEIYNANCPVALRIVQVYAYISTGGGTGAQRISFRTAIGGGGSALSGTMTTATTGFKSVNTSATATTQVAANGSIYLYREDRDVAGEAYIVTMEE